VAVSEIFNAFVNDEVRLKWLPAQLTIRKATPSRSVRITWQDGSSVDVYIMSKGESKGTVTIQHGRLASREAADAAREFWAERLDQLAKLLIKATRRS